MIGLMLLLNVIGIGAFDDPILPPGMWDDRGPVDFHLWNHNTLTTAYNGTMVESPGASTLSARWRVDGDGFTIKGVKFDGAGSANICVNGACEIISWASGNSRPATIIEVTNLGVGIHDVTLTSLGTGWINVDAIYVYPRAVVPTPESTPEALPEYINLQDDGSRFENRMDSGQRAIIALNAMMVVIILFGVGYLVVWHDN